MSVNEISVRVSLLETCICTWRGMLCSFWVFQIRRSFMEIPNHGINKSQIRVRKWNDWRKIKNFKSFVSRIYMTREWLSTEYV